MGRRPRFARPEQFTGESRAYLRQLPNSCPTSIRPERGRRKCLERILPVLESTGVETLKLESRWKQEDAADIDMAVALRNRKVIDKIGIEHVKPDAGEPRLWVPD